jgi:hypothetical protein
MDHRQAAIDAARKALEDAAVVNNAGYMPGDEELAAELAIDAAAPHLGAAVYERIAELASQWRDEAGKLWSGKRPPRSDLDLERRGYAEALQCCARDLEAALLAAKLTALGVPPAEQAMYANAIQQDPGWRERLPAVTTRAQLDHYTENGVVPDA